MLQTCFGGYKSEPYHRSAVLKWVNILQMRVYTEHKGILELNSR